MTNTVSALNRRRLFQVAGAAAVAATAAELVTSCGGSSNDASPSASGAGSAQPTAGASASSAPGRATASGPSSTGASGGPASSVLPGYVEHSGAKPDLPAIAQGVDAGYLAYPKAPVAFFTEKPGSGSPVTMMSASAPLLPLSKNRLWQNLNKELGVEVQFQTIPNAGTTYQDKFATVIAGGDLPDVMSIQPPLANLDKVLDAKFTDLTPHLSGDNVKKYPALAALPADMWRSTVYNGRLYGVPCSFGLMGAFLLCRSDLLKAKSLSLAPADGADFLATCQALTDPGKSRWALGGDPVNSIFPMFQQMCGAPTGWTETGGKFVSAYEDPNTKAALGHIKDFWSAGVINPDSFASPGSATTWLLGGQIAIALKNFGSWVYYMTTQSLGSGVAFDAIVAPKWDGGGLSRQYLLNPTATFSALRKGVSQDRAEMILRVLDYFAVPFGTKEYLSLHYGVEGVDYTLRGSDPVLTKAGQNEVLDPLSWLVSIPETLYNPGFPDATRLQYAFAKKVLPDGVSSAANGLFSATDASKGQSLGSSIGGVIGDIIQGRKPLSAWDGAVKTWRQQGGDTIRTEYEKAWQAAQ